MKILVTGGTGYIGSHTVVELLEHGHEVVIVDNLSNSKITVLERIKKITGKDVPFYQLDVTNQTLMDPVFATHHFDGVIHFAGFKAVGESVAKPIMYYFNNTVSTMVLCELCFKYGVNRFVFSSSATVYGNNKVPYVEDMELKPTTNPYGETKVISERILRDVANVNPNLSVALLRYFNPVGAHKSGLLGESPNGVPNNLMPYITQVAKGKLSQLRIFGNQYATIDGTGVRDYIHVMDLARGHVAALEKIGPGVHVYNLGTGRGTSVLELVKAFETANQLKIPYVITDPRPGDLPAYYADATKAKRELGWTCQENIYDMCVDAWRYEKNNED